MDHFLFFVLHDLPSTIHDNRRQQEAAGSSRKQQQHDSVPLFRIQPHTHHNTNHNRRPNLHLPVTCHLNNSNGMCLNPEDLASEMARYATSNVFAVWPPPSSNDRWCS